MYEYYFKVSDEEHYLNAGEVATVMNLYTTGGLPHKQLASVVLRTAQATACVPQAYYHTGKGMMAVYPKDIWMAAIRSLQYLTCGKRKGTCRYEGKNYNFIKRMPPSKIEGKTISSIIIDEVTFQ